MKSSEVQFSLQVCPQLNVPVQVFDSSISFINIQVTMFSFKLFFLLL